MIAGELTKQLLQATPEQATEIQALFKDLGTLQNTGVDTLAKQIYETSGLATDELKNAYVSAQNELATALATENAAYAKSAEDLQVKFEDAVSKLAVARNNAITKSLTAMNDALGTSAKTLKDALVIVNNGIAETSENVASRVAQIGVVQSVATNLLSTANQATIAYGSQTYGATPVTPMVTNGPTINTEVNVSTNATPQDISQAVVNNIKFNLPITTGGVTP